MRRTPALFAAVPFALLAFAGGSTSNSGVGFEVTSNPGGAFHVTPNPGVVFEITTTDFTTEPATVDVAQIEIEGENVSMGVSGGDGEGQMVFRGETREMLVIDHEERSYMLMDSAMVAGLANQMNAAMAQMEQMLAQLPDDQRALVEEMRARGMGGMPGMDAMTAAAPEIDIRRSGRSDTRAGFAADEWEVFEDGVLARRLWVAAWSEIDGGEEARNAMSGMVDFFDQFLAAMPTMPGQDEPMIRNPFRNFDMGNGMPVMTEELGPDGQVESETIVTGVERRELGPEAFAPPSDYTRRELPGG